jgi:YgiT-type zinc finger domain-containing protein
MKTKNEIALSGKKSYWEGEVCETCGGSCIKDAVVEVYRHRGIKRHLFQNVPAGVCSDCHTRYFSGHIARMMEERMRHAFSSKNQKSITLPILTLP